MNIFFIMSIILGLFGIAAIVDDVRDGKPAFIKGWLLVILFGLSVLLALTGYWQYVETH